MKGNVDDYRNILSGRLEYTFTLDTDKTERTYFGKIKLNKEPKIEDFGHKNIIMQGSKLKCVDW